MKIESTSNAIECIENNLKTVNCPDWIIHDHEIQLALIACKQEVYAIYSQVVNKK